LNNLQERTEAKRVSAQPLVLVADDDPDTRLLFRTVLEVAMILRTLFSHERRAAGY
jgi:CheY-like chemotaxis protein